MLFLFSISILNGFHRDAENHTFSSVKIRREMIAIACARRHANLIAVSPGSLISKSENQIVRELRENTF